MAAGDEKKARDEDDAKAAWVAQEEAKAAAIAADAAVAAKVFAGFEVGCFFFSAAASAAAFSAQRRCLVPMSV